MQRDWNPSFREMVRMIVVDGAPWGWIGRELNDLVADGWDRLGCGALTASRASDYPI
jgi:hypothetical protein